jgi:hypothetical protein
MLRFWREHAACGCVTACDCRHRLLFFGSAFCCSFGQPRRPLWFACAVAVLFGSVLRIFVCPFRRSAAVPYERGLLCSSLLNGIGRNRACGSLRSPVRSPTVACAVNPVAARERERASSQLLCRTCPVLVSRCLCRHVADRQRGERKVSSC